MDYQQLADQLFPDVTDTITDLEKRYPSRDLAEGAFVTRLGPSPTGFMHIGNLYTGLINERLAHQSSGRFFLRIEDTDHKRYVDGAEEVITDALAYFGINYDEGVFQDGERGAYGPYHQSERAAIYHVVAKHLVAKGYAYPSFATEEELAALRTAQEAEKADTGYYGKWAKDRFLSLEDIRRHLDAGDPWTLRLRSRALPEEKRQIPDGIRGHVTVHPNKQDVVLLKTNGIPTYHFAHVVDDHFMRTSHVVRGEEWLATLPIHLELFDILGWPAPLYCHTSHLMKIDGDTRRKLSKRQDPEMALSYYMEKGYHPTSVREYLMILINSDYEEWRLANPEAPLTDFPVTLDKMATSGALYDMVKLDDVAKESLLHISEEDLATFLIHWADQYAPDAAPILAADKAVLVRLLGIGRDGKKPRKDLVCAAQILAHVSYFFDDWFKLEDPLPEAVSPTDAQTILRAYLAGYDGADDNSAWFAKVRDIATANGYAARPKDYKKDPDAYKGHVGDVSAVIRLAVTGRSASPDLWSVQHIMGENRVRDRIEKFLAHQA